MEIYQKPQLLQIVVFKGDKYEIRKNCCKSIRESKF